MVIKAMDLCCFTFDPFLNSQVVVFNFIFSMRNLYFWVIYIYRGWVKNRNIHKIFRFWSLIIIFREYRTVNPAWIQSITLTPFICNITCQPLHIFFNFVIISFLVGLDWHSKTNSIIARYIIIAGTGNCIMML